MPEGRGRPFLARRLAAEPALRRRVETAERLGIAPSRLDGREPDEVTEHEYDGDHLVRSITRREPEWTDQDRAELEALAVYRAGLCPKCGGPMDECTAKETRGERFKASRVRCQRSDAVLRAQKALDESGNTPLPEALIWSSTPTGR